MCARGDAPCEGPDHDFFDNNHKNWCVPSKQTIVHRLTTILIIMVLPILIGIAICVAVEEYKKRKKVKAQRRQQEIVDAYENGIVDTPDSPDAPPPPYSKKGSTSLPKPLKPQQSPGSSKTKRNKLDKLHIFSRKRDRQQSVHASDTTVGPVNSGAADYPPPYTY